MIKSMPKIDREKIQELLTRGVNEIIDKVHLEQRLERADSLRVKLGIDPTSPNLHIGRAVVLWKLRQFQELGHQVIFIVGDFTGLVGDTSDKDAERPMMSPREIKRNMKTYAEQAFKILDRNKTEIHYNSEWLSNVGYDEISRMADQFSIHEFEEREVIARRLKAGKRVSLREMLYPLMQGYDSVAVRSDVELGGTDQRFNLLAGRVIQSLYDQKPQDILMMNLLEGTDGRKMSSSWGNIINITDEPNEMFGKVMSVDDNLIIKYFEHATRVPLAEIAGIEKELKAGTNPRDIKKRLAGEIVALYYGKKTAASASKEWSRVFSQKEKPSEIQEVEAKSVNIIDILVEVGLAPSRSEAKRLIKQKGVKIDDQIASESSRARPGSLIQVGPRRFVKIKK